jgi:hypothetical protein
MSGAHSDEKMGLSFTITAGPRQCTHSWVRGPRDSWSYFTVSDSRLPQPGGPGPLIYIPQEQAGPVIPPGTGFPFGRLLRLAGLRWRYSTPPSRWDATNSCLPTSQSQVTLRLTVSQSVSLGIEPRLGLMTRYLVLFDSYGLVFFVGRPLCREDGSVFCQSHCLHY